MELQTSETFDIPTQAGDVQVFLNQLPRQANLTFNVIQGGHQRDPYPASIRITAKWEASYVRENSGGAVSWGGETR